MICSKLRCINLGVQSFVARLLLDAARCYFLDSIWKIGGYCGVFWKFLALKITLESDTTEGCIRARPTSEEAERSDIGDETSNRFSTPNIFSGQIGKSNKCQKVIKSLKIISAT